MELRRLLARELHDRVAQTLTGMLVDVENFKSEQVGWQDVLRQLDTIQTSTRQVLTNIRQLLHDLRGEEALSLGLVDAIRGLARGFQEKTGINVDLEVSSSWPSPLTPAASLNLYRIVEEALTNIRMHSGARNVSVVLRCDPEDQLVLLVTDDGRGVDTDPARPMGLGTIGMRERAVFLGGRLAIGNSLGGGTTIEAILPARPLVITDLTSSANVMIPKGITA